MARLFVSLLLVSAVTCVVDAQQALLARPDVKVAMEYLAAQNSAHTQKQIAIAQIPAPGFKEADRARFMESEFKRVGLADVQIDQVGNVIGWRRGESERILVLAAHTDTVFPAGTDLTVKRDGTKLIGPGLVDDSRGLVSLLALAEALNQAHISTRRTLLFVADVGEEGLGNLRGVKHLFADAQLRARVDGFITIDGLEDATVTNGAVGSRRYRIRVSGPGGHSWFNFGIVNPAHAVGRIIGRIAEIDVPELPKTTYNVGLLGGGTSINSVPFETWFEVDMRSEGKAELQRLEERVLQAIKLGVDEENLLRAKSGTTLKVEATLVGDRPVGLTPANSPLVVAAQWATTVIGETPQLNFGSNDAGAATALGIPAIAVGACGTGGGAHSLTEWFETEGAYKGIQRVLLTILAFDERPSAAGERATK
jgi:acetylornithine deacetylase/succinyl-diaminopimelate desuccinylase-like protein